MKTDFFDEEYLEGSIKSCQEKGQQVAFSTYHNALTQVCFTCGAVRTSINYDEVWGSKRAKPLSYFDSSKKEGKK